jgi:hypothetical protein
MAAKVQVIFYSMYGHVHQMASAIADGARGVADVDVTLLQVPELVPYFLRSGGSVRNISSNP